MGAPTLSLGAMEHYNSAPTAVVVADEEGLTVQENRESRTEYHLPPWARLLVFLLAVPPVVAGAALVLAFPMLGMAFDAPGSYTLARLCALLAVYLTLVAGLLLPASLLLCVASSGVASVRWRCGGRVPCPAPRALGDMFSCFR